MEPAIKIVGGLSEFKEEKQTGKSLLQRIEEAGNESEINYLLKVGGTYKNASNGTLKMWAKAASKRLESFKKSK